MFHGGFGHCGEDRPFKTLQKAFRIRDEEGAVIGEMIRDPDLLDEKFGGKERFGIDQGLNGWAKQAIPDGRLLERALPFVEGRTLRS